jgi:hypothetical protein
MKRGKWKRPISRGRGGSPTARELEHADAETRKIQVHLACVVVDAMRDSRVVAPQGETQPRRRPRVLRSYVTPARVQRGKWVLQSFDAERYKDFLSRRSKSGVVARMPKAAAEKAKTLVLALKQEDPGASSENIARRLLKKHKTKLGASRVRQILGKSFKESVN